MIFSSYISCLHHVEVSKRMKRPAAADGEKAAKKAAKGAASRPPEPPPGLPQTSVHYRGGKILRSDSAQVFRVYRKLGDRNDYKVPFKGCSAAAWQRALDELEAQP
eukprot:11213241-Karenia_brevis.AAC.1